MLALFPSLTADSIAKSNVLKDSALRESPVVHLSRHHPLVVRLPTANGLDPSGIAVRAEAGPGQPSKSVPQALQPRIGKIGPIGQEPAEHSTRGARSCVSKPRLALIRVPQSFVARS
jgi:hypothetical protein